jgi:hypothetical protein
MNQWIKQFVENEIVNRTHKTDKPRGEGPLSVLSVRPRGLLDEKVEKVENNLETGTDKTDKPTDEGPLSVLSVRPLELLDEKMKKVENNPETGTDKTDKSIDEGLLSVLSVRPLELVDENFSPYGEQEFEERLAIAEYDGDQTSLHAHRIAYLDAFISVLTTLPATDLQRDWLDQRIQTTDLQRDWLDQRIQTTLAWIEDQKFLALT